MAKQNKQRTNKGADGAATASSKLPKLSERILVLADRLMPEKPSEQETRVAISLAVLAWNVAVVPPEKRQEGLSVIGETMPDLNIIDRQEVENSVLKIAEVKERLFPDDRRFAINYRLVEEEGGLQFEVAATSPEG